MIVGMAGSKSDMWGRLATCGRLVIGIAQLIGMPQQGRLKIGRRLQAYPTLLGLLSVPLLQLPLHADLKLTIKSGNRTTVEYYKGTLSRREMEPGGPYTIIDSAGHHYFFVDPARREYSEYSTQFVGKVVAKSADTIHIDISSRDTGERRTMFGHQAQHWITTMRQSMEYQNRPPVKTQEVTTDAWYLDAPYNVPQSSAVLYGYTNGLAPNVKMTHEGPQPHGVPVWKKTGNFVTEVVEFSEAPLDPKLFQPPARFRRMIRPIPGQSLSWGDQVIFYWQRFEDWLGNIL